MQIDLVQLRTFVAVAEERHLTCAAERLHMSVSAASMHVRAIEDYFDLQLFVRTKRSLALTRAGQLILEKAKSLLNEAALLTSFAREIRGKIEGHLVLSASAEPAPTRIAEVIGALRARHPLISVDLRARPSASTQQGLKSGEFDIGLLLGRPIDVELTYYELQTVLFKIAGPAAWKEKIENANWGELASLPWIAPADNSITYTAMLNNLFQERGLKLNIVATFDNAALGRAMLETGVGLMLVREVHASQGLAQGTMAVSPIVEVQFQLFMAHLASRRDDPLISAFLEASTDVWPDLRVTPPLAALKQTITAGLGANAVPLP